MDDRRISRTLSFWLRHRPDAGALTLDEEGWADAGAVLAALRGKGLDVSDQRLAQVVAGNDKQRFELSSDGSRIRARQGHSVAVEGDWRKAAPPALLYHGTVEAALAAIRAEGLRPMRRHHVHLSPDRATAIKVGSRRGAPVVLTVRCRGDGCRRTQLLPYRQRRLAGRVRSAAVSRFLAGRVQLRRCFSACFGVPREALRKLCAAAGKGLPGGAKSTEREQPEPAQS